jgi:hypothetical protein
MITEADVLKKSEAALKPFKDTCVFANEAPDSPIDYLAVVEVHFQAKRTRTTMDDTLSDVVTLLKEIEANNCCVSVHYANINWSPAKGTRIKDALLAQGVIQEEKVSGKSGRPWVRLKINPQKRHLFL